MSGEDKEAFNKLAAVSSEDQKIQLVELDEQEQNDMFNNGYNKDLDGIHLTQEIGAWVNEKSYDGSTEPQYGFKKRIK